MFQTINWRIIFNASTKEKAQKVVNKFSGDIGAMDVLSFQRYWKDETKFVMECITQLQIEQPAEAVYWVLQQSNLLGTDITVIGPTLYDKRVEFELVCSNPKMAGVDWFHLKINNFDGPR